MNNEKYAKYILLFFIISTVKIGNQSYGLILKFHRNELNLAVSEKFKDEKQPAET